jgi:hypothetical protein
LLVVYQAYGLETVWDRHAAALTEPHALVCPAQDDVLNVIESHVGLPGLVKGQIFAGRSS